MEGICKLYQKNCTLKESHIVPKFAIDYFKATGSKYLRSFSNPNRRLQDGLKRYYLSEKAELDFSKREKWFAENVFRPFLEDRRRLFEYDENLYYFLVSVLWRSLISELENPVYHKAQYFDILLETEREWRQFLIDSTFPKNYSDVNLFLTDAIRQHTFEVEGLDYYFTRTIDLTIFADEAGSYVAVYCKFLRFCIWSIIKDIRPNVNNELIINPKGGFLRFPQYVHDGYMISNMIKRVQVIESLPGPSISQQAKIEEEVERNPDSLFNSDAGRAIMNDLNIGAGKVSNKN